MVYNGIVSKRSSKARISLHAGYYSTLLREETELKKTVTIGLWRIKQYELCCGRFLFIKSNEVFLNYLSRMLLGILFTEKSILWVCRFLPFTSSWEPAIPDCAYNCGWDDSQVDLHVCLNMWTLLLDSDQKRRVRQWRFGLFLVNRRQLIIYI